MNDQKERLNVAVLEMLNPAWLQAATAAVAKMAEAYTSMAETDMREIRAKFAGRSAGVPTDVTEILNRLATLTAP